jgi:hypothetical protein
MKTAGVEGLGSEGVGSEGEGVGSEGVGGDIQRVGRQTRESGPQ